uniref:Uncharacterized protein LOC104265552 n=1 Tax=Phallusia mammillata TaxID=59560 RepID=A0A6F9DJD9_9ASCI|nr:uncharacterized protein LOC104265552 [Phallusia mammillata]
MKKFVFVKFLEGGQSYVVFNGWLVGLNRCRWPTDGNIQSMVKEEMEAKDTWPIYSCEILCQSNTYDRCLKKAYLQHIVETTDEEDVTVNQAPPLTRTQSISPKQLFAVSQIVPKKKRKSANAELHINCHYNYQLRDMGNEIIFLATSVQRLEKKIDQLIECPKKRVNSQLPIAAEDEEELAAAMKTMPV